MNLKDLKKKQRPILYARVDAETKAKLLRMAKVAGYTETTLGKFIDALIKSLGVLLLIASCSKEPRPFIHEMVATKYAIGLYMVCSPQVSGKCLICKQSGVPDEQAMSECKSKFLTQFGS